MRFSCRLLLCALVVALLLCVQLVLGGAAPGLQQRDRHDRLLLLQRATTSTEPEQAGRVPAASASATPRARVSGGDRASSSSRPSKTGDSTPSAASASSAPVESGIYEAPGLVYSGQGLPIAPEVTPGLGVAGVFLMVAGLCCCLIGIKIKRLHIFLSMAYLTSLSVTVLIVYVMNPPVRNAIQGAYVTATIITGCVIGGIAVVFPEVTEGLGCLLGGFCLSMWFLVLKPGGLVTSVYGKLIVIGSFCLIVFALAFHHRTRPWGLIGSLSFAGATSIVLGIDCFSRAGLKEFWIYIWALNDNIFPLRTNTYPHTRGMKVEIAGIFIIFALGVMSQMKLWKILQERREAREALRRQQDADLEAVDEESGRRVEAEYQAERDRWEAVYGDRKPGDSGDSKPSRPTTGGSKADSGLGDDEVRGSGEIAQSFVETSEMREAREGHIQMVGIRRHSPSNQEGAIPVGVEGDQPPPPPSSASNSPSASRRNSYDRPPQTQVGSDEHGEQPQPPDVRPQAPPPPAVIPLPLPILHEGGDDDDDDDDDGSSVATRADSDHFSLDRRQKPGHFSLESDAPRMDLPYDRASKASSLAATCDERLEAEDDGLPELTTEIARSTHGLELDSDATPTAEPPPPPPPQEPMAEAVESADLAPEPRPDTTVTSAPPIPSKSESQPTLQLLPQDLVPSSYPRSKASSSVSRNDIQTQCPKVVKTFRTNEWAKHLTEADKPDPEEILFTQADEKPAPLDIEELQGTSDVPQRPAVSRKESRRSVSASGPPPSSAAAAAAAVPTSTLAPASAQRTSFRASSAPQVEKPPTPAEQHSVPFAAGNGPLIDRAVSAAAAVREEDRFPKEGTLLGQRETMVRNRASFTAHGRYDTPSPSSTPVSRGSGDPQRSASAMSFGAPMQQQAGTIQRAPLSRQPSNLDTLNDDMPLADRQQLLHQSISQQSLSRQSWNPPPPVAAPQRRPTPMPPQQRAEMLSGWREGTRTDQQQQELANAVDQRRAKMLNERNQAATLERQKMIQGNLRGSYMEERMRQRDMLELHNETIRKIQATANKNAR